MPASQNDKLLGKSFDPRDLNHVYHVNVAVDSFKAASKKLENVEYPLNYLVGCEVFMLLGGYTLTAIAILLAVAGIDHVARQGMFKNNLMNLPTSMAELEDRRKELQSIFEWVQNSDLPQSQLYATLIEAVLEKSRPGIMASSLNKLLPAPANPPADLPPASPSTSSSSFWNQAKVAGNALLQVAQNAISSQPSMNNR